MCFFFVVVFGNDVYFLLTIESKKHKNARKILNRVSKRHSRSTNVSVHLSEELCYLDNGNSNVELCEHGASTS